MVFRLYDSVANCLLHGDTVGSGGLLYKETKSSSGGALTETVATNNTTASVNADSTVAWYVTYDPKNAAFTGRQSNCVETTALDFTNDAGPGSLFP